MSLNIRPSSPSIDASITTETDRGSVALPRSLSRGRRIKAWLKNSQLFNRRPQLYSGARTEWQPAALQPVVLLTIILFTVAVIVAIQVLRHYTAVDRGFAFVIARDGAFPSFPAFTTFGYLYFPTILAVVFSMFWSWVDLDVKRLEPYYQMAKPGGAALPDSLSLQYPFDYVALVPIHAARRRYVMVLC